MAEEYPHGKQLLDMAEVEKRHGDAKARALTKYQGNLQLRKEQAMEIINVLWGEAPEDDKMAAAALCVSYRLNPLAGHVFLIPFSNRETGEKTWSRVMGIRATRLLAQRPAPGSKEPQPYGYEDLSPRIMTVSEQEKVWGKVDKENLCYLTIVKDVKSGATAYGFGKWPKAKGVKGADKGNSPENMASIRSERQALDRLRPGEMPDVDDVADEAYVEGAYRELTEADMAKQVKKDIGDFWAGPGPEDQGDPGSVSVPELGKAASLEAEYPHFKNWGELAGEAENLGVKMSEVLKRAGLKAVTDFVSHAEAWDIVLKLKEEKKVA